MIIPGKSQFILFKGNIYDSYSNIIADFVRLIIVLFLAVLMIFEIKQNFKLTKNIKESILDVKTILTFCIILLFFISILDRIIFLSFNKDVFLQPGEIYYDTYYNAYSYTWIYIIESLLFGAVSIKLLIIFKIFEYIRLFYQTVEDGFISFIKYSFSYLLIIIGYTVISYLIWGNHLVEFSTFGSSFIQVLMFTMGNLF